MANQYQDNMQMECVDIMMQNVAGQIILPTGAGKSRIEYTYIGKKFKADNGKHKVAIIVVPRIMLGQQHIKEIRKILQQYNLLDNEWLTFVSSGIIPSIEENGKKILGKNQGHHTCRADEIALRLTKSREQKKNDIVICTYASFDNFVKGLDEYSGQYSRETFEAFLIADEAHHFTKGDDNNQAGSSFEALNENLHLFDSRFFFTATPRIYSDETDNSSGMNNDGVYGKVIYSKLPKELIAHNVICMPVLQTVIFEKPITEDKFRENGGDFVLKAFEEHERLINRNCGIEELKDILGAKVLVAVDSRDQYHALKTKGFIDKANEMGIVVAGTMSNNPQNTDEIFINHTPYEMDEFLTKIRRLGQMDAQRMIVLHYNQLTEGIDIPAMTGLIVLREMSKKNAIQNIGRILRIHNKDRDKDCSNISNWIKPCAYVIVPHLDSTNNFRSLIEALRDEYVANIRIESYDTCKGNSNSNATDVLGDKIIPCKLVHEVEDFEQKLAKILANKDKQMDFSFLKRKDDERISGECRGQQKIS